MHYVLGVDYLETCDNSATDSPYLPLFNDTFIILGLLYQVSQKVPLRCVLHHEVKVPVAMLVLFEKAVVQLDEVRGWEFFQEECLFHNLKFHVVIYIFPHEYAL